MTAISAICTACDTEKPASEFHKKAANPNGLQLKCKACTASYRAAYHAASIAAVDPATEYQGAHEPGAASPTLGEGGTPEKKDEKSKLSTMLDAAIAKQENAKAETDQAAFGRVQQSTRLAAREPVSATSDATMRSAGFADLPHAAIVRSKTNPRTHFDEAFLKDLAANIKANGILQAILVRPLPASRVVDSLDDWVPGTPRPTHEIVAGEQRWRAAGIAGLASVPAMIRDLTDDQVLELQLVENLKRRDLHAMEESEGYERLIAATGMTVDEVAERIGKGRTYVYGSLSLLRLIPEARAAFYEGKLTRSVAELIARHTDTLQPAILKDVTAPDHRGEGMSYRRAKEHIENTFMLQLAAAPFDTTDVSLVPAAGACATCPMRSGSNPDLFGDFANADTCTNPPCYNGKRTAHEEKITAEAAARGQSVILGKAAREIMPERDGKLRGYTRVDSNEGTGKSMRSLREVLGDRLPTPTLIEDPVTHKLIEAIPTAEAGKLLRESKGKAKPAAAPPPAPEPTAQDLAAEYETQWRKDALHQAADCPVEFITGSTLMREVAVLLAMSLQGLGLDAAADLVNIGAVARREGLVDHVRALDPRELFRWVHLLAMAHDLQDLTAPARRIEAAAPEFSIDIKATQRRIQTVMKLWAAEKAPPAPAPAPAAKPSRAPRVKKTVDQFNAEISEALNNVDAVNAFKPGEQVRIKADITRGVDVFDTRGMSAEIIEAAGDRQWIVQPEGWAFRLQVDYTEIEAL